ncbi:hypothetical protein SAMN04487884_107120 [Butyrivibrio fibrisolvens]|uniref:DUF402 domain-containing protein n=1 Tax=Butyrivibrio fibrisolvens TaxID=831 RepID=A0A1H9QCU1_BUTFI|nr:DUF402 domain-containing protein [Butyrivibrio fibrisolvens]SER58222.1 hypothetical protein SAMN04487884_107120 [Butyrivibrio fibrisolvens]
MDNPILYRKRIIPDECIKLKDDVILYHDSNMIMTSWRAFRPKDYLSYGYSCYFLDHGFKMSKFYRSDDTFSRWYFDIVSFQEGPEKGSIMVVDLLADVIVYPDHSFKVVDLDELADALNKNLITSGQMQECLENLDRLLKIIYEGKLSDLIMPLELQISRFQSASNAASKPLLL